MQFQDTFDIKHLFVDHLDALRAYCNLVTRYGQRLTDVEKEDRKLREHRYIQAGRAFGLSEGALRSLIRTDVARE
jgi:hypothetical protein